MDGRARRKKGTKTVRIHTPVKLTTHERFINAARIREVSVGVILDEFAEKYLAACARIFPADK